MWILDGSGGRDSKLSKQIALGFRGGTGGGEQVGDWKPYLWGAERMSCDTCCM